LTPALPPSFAYCELGKGKKEEDRKKRGGGEGKERRMSRRSFFRVSGPIGGRKKRQEGREVRAPVRSPSPLSRKRGEKRGDGEKREGERKEGGVLLTCLG